MTITRDRIEITVPSEFVAHITPELQAEIAAYYREMIDRVMARLIFGGDVPEREQETLYTKDFAGMLPNGSVARKRPTYWQGILNLDCIT